ncbi:MAG: hypothetical protein Q7S28_01440 [bacterium]|nr:hypothetical protein [bacterium]
MSSGDSSLKPDREEALTHAVMVRIREEKRRREARAKIACFGALAGGALGVIIVSIQAVYAGFMESGFSQFAALLMTDGKLIAVYWQDFALSLAETFPTLGVTVLLSGTFVFFLACNSIAHTMRTVPLRRLNHI